MKVKKAVPLILAMLIAGGVFATGCVTNNNNNNNNNNSGGDDTNQGTTDKDDGKDDGNKDNTDKDEGNKPDEGNKDEETPSTPLPADKKIYVVGDSTVCSFDDPYFLPRYGYGTQLAEYLNVTSSQIVNLALSGRSSKSFLTEGNYTTLKNSIAEGDYLIIGFGHNDEKSDDSARFTSAKGDHTTAGSFQKSLYDNYVKLAVDKGATPILCTPVTRYDASGNYTGSKVHNTSDGDYAKAIKTLGEATQTTVIDLTALTVAEYKKDNAAAIYYHAHTTRKGAAGATVGNEEPEGRDDTHLNKFGAKMVAYQFANALKGTDSKLKAHVKDNIVAPTKAVDYVDAVNKGFKKSAYKPFDPANTTATKLTTTNTNGTTVDWYATAMGELAGDSVSPFKISYAGEKFTVGSNSQKGKISSTVDGFGAAFIQIDTSKNFTASATVKVTSLTGADNASKAADNQSAFGMMLRDDIIINKRDTTLASNYVAAGAFAVSNKAVFCRENGSLKNKGTLTVAVDKVYTVSITRLGQRVDVSMSDGTTTVTETYTDFDFVAVDNGNMYLCLFATRSIVAEFSNVQFEIKGTSQGA